MRNRIFSENILRAYHLSTYNEKGFQRSEVRRLKIKDLMSARWRRNSKTEARAQQRFSEMGYPVPSLSELSWNIWAHLSVCAWECRWVLKKRNKRSRSLSFILHTLLYLSYSFLICVLGSHLTVYSGIWYYSLPDGWQLGLELRDPMPSYLLHQPPYSSQLMGAS